MKPPYMLSNETVDTEENSIKGYDKIFSEWKAELAYDLKKVSNDGIDRVGPS